MKAKKADKALRSKEEVDRDYQQHAVLLGHKSRILSQLDTQRESVQKEIITHLDHLLELNQEGIAVEKVLAAAPKTEAVPPEVAMTEGSGA